MMQLPKLARPYAKAAFTYAMEQKQLTQWAQMLQAMALLVSEPAVQQLLRNPKYNTEQHAELGIALGKDILDAAGQNFIKLLAKNHRLAALPSIAEQFEQLRANAEKTLEVRVKSAIPLDQDYQAHLIQLLSARFGLRIVLHCEVDPSIVGGIIIYAGDCVIDGSVQGQLQRMRELVVH